MPHIRCRPAIPPRNVSPCVPLVAPSSITHVLIVSLSPRWLVEHGHLNRARKSLHWLREGSFSDEAIEDELTEIRNNFEGYKDSRTNWLTLFKERNLFNRLWRAALLQFMAQMCGATAMKYYLPTLFLKLGLGTRMSLLAGGIESTLKIGMTIIEMLIIDRLGRRLTLVLGCAAMTFSMMVRNRSHWL